MARNTGIIITTSGAIFGYHCVWLAGGEGGGGGDGSGGGGGGGGGVCVCERARVCLWSLDQKK